MVEAARLERGQHRHARSFSVNNCRNSIKQSFCVEHLQLCFFVHEMCDNVIKFDCSNNEMN